MIPFNFHHLYYFFIIAREGSVSKAAKELRLGQPALSTQLKQFENYLNVKLFEREGKRLVLTEEGKHALYYAKEIFDLGQEFIDGFGDRSKVGRLRIQIGVLSGIPKAFVDALLKLILRLEPNVYIILQEEKIEKLVENLKTHLFDLVLTDVPFQTSAQEQIQNHLVGKIPIVFCASSELAKKYRKLPEDLRKAPIILPTSHSQIYHAVQEYFLQQEITPRVVAEIQDVETVRRLVLAGVGIAPLNEFTVKNAPASEKLTILFRKSKHPIYDSIYLITKKRRKPHLLTEKILQQFQLAT